VEGEWGMKREKGKAKRKGILKQVSDLRGEKHNEN